MVKRKTPQSPSTATSPRMADEHRNSGGEDPTPALYTAGEWAGRPHYRCAVCKYDTLDEEAMLGHIEKMHRPRPTLRRAPSVFVADKRGNEISLSLTPDLTPSPSPKGEGSDGRGEEDGVFEVELQEVESTTDEQGNEHKIFSIKE